MISSITLADQLKEARRELALRQRCYPGWVVRGTLTQGHADYQLAAMAAIVETLARLVEAETQPALFAPSTWR